MDSDATKVVEHRAVAKEYATLLAILLLADVIETFSESGLSDRKPLSSSRIRFMRSNQLRVPNDISPVGIRSNLDFSAV